MKIGLICLLAALSCGLVQAQQKTAAPSRAVSPLINACGDDLAATDNAGRTLPSFDEAGPAKPDRYVGLFYWLWHTPLRNESTDDYDVTKSMLHDPDRTQWAFADYYWGEPELGYYRSTDEYVLQKHLNLFCLMGIDFLYLDFTNLFIDKPELQALLRVIHRMKAAGQTPPRLVPFFNTDPVPKLEQFYQEFFLNPDYRDDWFVFDGRPLVLSPVQHPDNRAINDAFTWRKMWVGGDAEGGWKYFDTIPMSPSMRNGRIEQSVVSPGLGGPLWRNHIYGSKSSTSKRTPVYDKYWKCPETGLGLFFEEQWEHAHRLQPQILCITGWNEWKAGAWHTTPGLVGAKFTFQGRLLGVGESYFVDEFNEEFNRDLEPQAGEYSDNYFYQMAGHIRRYKGMAASPEASAARKIDIDGRFAEWDDLAPRFADFTGEAARRDHDGTPFGVHYTNTTGRNDIVCSKVARDRKYLYFYVETAGKMSPWSDPNWMLLFIDADRDRKTGWEGYDFAVNMDVPSPTKTTLKKRAGDRWENIADCRYRLSGNRMEIAVPLAALGMTGKPDFYFHWMDNMQKIDDIREFFVNGDSAPERRYNYHYKAE